MNKQSAIMYIVATELLIDIVDEVKENIQSKRYENENELFCDLKDIEKRISNVKRLGENFKKEFPNEID